MPTLGFGIDAVKLWKKHGDSIGGNRKNPWKVSERGFKLQKLCLVLIGFNCFQLNLILMDFWIEFYFYSIILLNFVINCRQFDIILVYSSKILEYICVFTCLLVCCHPSWFLIGNGGGNFTFLDKLIDFIIFWQRFDCIFIVLQAINCKVFLL